MLLTLEDIAQTAGDAIQEIYQSGHIDVKQKADASPVTQADLLANDIICRGIRQFSNLPIISEEGVDEEPIHGSPVSYWLIDPIDGTKEFIARRPTFTVNIALIENGVPTLGVVLAPDRQEIYAGSSAGLRINRQPFSPQWSDPHRVVTSASHSEKEFDEFLVRNQLSSVVRIGSSIKFCLVAKGEAHFYPRYNSLSAWDIAAGHAVALAAGCEMIEIKTGQAVRYDYRRRNNPGFVLQAPGCVALR